MINYNDIYAAIFGAPAVLTYNSCALHFNVKESYLKESEKDKIYNTNKKYTLKIKNSKNTNRTREEIRQL